MECCLFLIFVFVTALQIVWGDINSTTEITIFSISNLKHSSNSKGIVGGQWLAIQEINNNPNFFPDYELKLKILDVHMDPQRALKQALNATQHKNTINSTYFPLILGAPWSSLSSATNPVLSAFNMGQISASATSISLSETNKYPYFYRTVPSDLLQAEGLMILCNTFNWTKIAVIHANDVYGLHLSLGIQELAKKNKIDVTSVAVSVYDPITYENAAKLIVDLNIYIAILIIHDSDVSGLFAAFATVDILRYPYFYLGCDAWLDDSIINIYNLSEITAGFIGTVPWQTKSLSLNEYTEDIQVIVNISITKYDELLRDWQYRYNNGDDKYLHIEIPGSYMIYGYDAMYTLAYTIQEIEDNHELYGGKVLDLIYEAKEGEHSEILIDALNDIIVNKIDFTGITGRVLFDDVGDRINGLYSFGNVLKNGNVDYFGYFLKDIDGSVKYKLNMDKIIWPKYFTDKNILPSAGILREDELIGIPTSVSLTIFIISLISMLFAIICIILSVYYRKNRIIKAASWRLNIIICIGAILAYIRTIMYGLDEISMFQCNLRVWILTIEYTLLFMPLFAKTYRLSQIFNKVLIKKAISDTQLFMLIAICVLIDIILLIILFCVKPIQRIYLKGNIEIIDEIQQTQYIYGSCTFNDMYFGDLFWCYYGIIMFWKMCQSVWGIHVSLSVARFSGGITNYQLFTLFDETGAQLFSILFTFIIIFIAVPIFVFSIIIHNVLLHYLVTVVSILLIGNLVVSINIFPRIYAVIRGNEESFQKSPAEVLESKIKKKLYELVTDQSWWSKSNTSKLKTISSVTKIDSYTNTKSNNSDKSNANRFASVGGSTLFGDTFTPLAPNGDHDDNDDDDDEDDDHDNDDNADNEDNKLSKEGNEMTVLCTTKIDQLHIN